VRNAILINKITEHSPNTLKFPLILFYTCQLNWNPLESWFFLLFLASIILVWSSVVLNGASCNCQYLFNKEDSTQSNPILTVVCWSMRACGIKWINAWATNVIANICQCSVVGLTHDWPVYKYVSFCSSSFYSMCWSFEHFRLRQSSRCSDNVHLLCKFHVNIKLRCSFFLLSLFFS
jgi:hypothetical protein